MAALGVDAVPDTDEVTKILETAARGRGKKSSAAILNNFFTFAAAATGLGISAIPTTEVGIWEAYGVGALDVLANYDKKDEFIKGLFSTIPGNTWPAEFVEFFTKKSNEVPDSSWCSKNGVAHYSEQRKRHVFFG